MSMNRNYPALPDSPWDPPEFPSPWVHTTTSPTTYHGMGPEREPAPAYSDNGVGWNQMEEDPPEVAIAVMGPTGSGKSTFVNLVSGSDLRVGKGLRSCTSIVQFSKPFNLDGRSVVMIDTPGFDDTTRSDTDVLKMIAAFLAVTYEEGFKLSGILYFHRISDYRAGGVSVRNLKMFKKLCGETSFPNVVVVTNMWGQVDPEIGTKREAQLKTDDLLYKRLLANGAHMMRHMNTVPSAEAIIRLTLNNKPRPLRIQEELVEENKDVSATSAGQELHRELYDHIRKCHEEIQALKEEMRQTKVKKGVEDARKLEINGEKQKIEGVEKEIKRLDPSYKAEKQKLRGMMGEEKGRFTLSWSFFGIRLRFDIPK